jgi:glutamyl-tRNA reductase
LLPEVNEFDGVYLYDIDSLQEIASETHELRRQQLAAAEAIIDEHVADFQKHLGLSQVRKATNKRMPSACMSGELRASEL